MTASKNEYWKSQCAILFHISCFKERNAIIYNLIQWALKQLVHTAVYGSSSTVGKFLLDRDWNTSPFLIDLSLTIDGPLIRNENSEGSGRNITWERTCQMLSSKLKHLRFCFVSVNDISVNFVKSPLHNEKIIWVPRHTVKSPKGLVFGTPWLYSAYNELSPLMW